MAPSLPSELWLEICQHLSTEDLWLSLRPVSAQLLACVEDTLKASHISLFTINLSFSLGSGSHHRWYDVRGSTTLSHTSLSAHNPQYALFSHKTYTPLSCTQRVYEKWNQICSAGIGSDLEWRVQAHPDSPTRSVRLPSLMLSNDHGVWCDWREMLQAYFANAHLPDRNHMWAWQAI